MVSFKCKTFVRNKYIYKKVEVTRSYELRSRNTVVEQQDEGVSTGGLALNPAQKPRLGRKNLLSKAQVQAAIDVKQGK